MPLVEFKNHETGEIKEFLVSSDLDNFSDGTGAWAKLEVPTSFAIGGMRSAPSQSEMIKRGYHRQENSKKGWRSEFSRQKVKKIWGL